MGCESFITHLQKEPKFPKWKLRFFFLFRDQYQTKCRKAEFKSLFDEPVFCK